MTRAPVHAGARCAVRRRGGEKSDRAPRGAWCYGDPGVSIALLGAARRLADARLEDEATVLGLESTQRPFEETRVEDGLVCHGAAGLMHINNRLFQATGRTAFAEAAREWFDRLLELKKPSGHPFPIRIERHVEEQAGPLMGTAGVLAALISATSAIEPRWDGMLLADLPDAADG